MLWLAFVPVTVYIHYASVVSEFKAGAQRGA